MRGKISDAKKVYAESLYKMQVAETEQIASRNSDMNLIKGKLRRYHTVKRSLIESVAELNYLKEKKQELEITKNKKLEQIEIDERNEIDLELEQ